MKVVRDRCREWLMQNDVSVDLNTQRARQHAVASQQHGKQRDDRAHD